MYCTQCGGQLTQGDKYCGSCGIRIIRTTSQHTGEPVITNSTLEPDPKKLAEQATKEAEQLTNRRNASPSVSHFQQDRNIQNTIDRTINRMFSQKEKNKWRIGIIWECAIKGKTRRPLSDVTAQLSKWIHSESAFVELTGADV